MPKSLFLILLLLLPACSHSSSGVGLFREQGDGIPLARQAALGVAGITEADKTKITQQIPLMELYDIQPATAWQVSYRWMLGDGREMSVMCKEVPSSAGDCVAMVRRVPANDEGFVRFSQQERRLPGARKAALSAEGLTDRDRGHIEVDVPRMHYYKLMDGQVPGMSAYIWQLEGSREMAVSYTDGEKAGAGQFVVRLYKVK